MTGDPPVSEGARTASVTVDAVELSASGAGGGPGGTAAAVVNAVGADHTLVTPHAFVMAYCTE